VIFGGVKPGDSTEYIEELQKVNRELIDENTALKYSNSALARANFELAHKWNTMSEVVQKLNHDLDSCKNYMKAIKQRDDEILTLKMSNFLLTKEIDEKLVTIQKLRAELQEGQNVDA
jgi:predicted RNase H-like nuclease (RuvC/YqgF family)